MFEVDVRDCPYLISVARTKKAIDSHPGQCLIVLVKSAAFTEDVVRLARSCGYAATIEAVEKGFRLLLSPATG